MSVEQAAIFLAGSILVMLGLTTIVVFVVIINNVIHKYWNPIKFMKYLGGPDYTTEAPRVEPKTKPTK